MILVINCGSSKTPEFGRFLTEAGLDHTIVALEAFSQAQVDASTGLIISGAPILLTEVDSLPYLQKFAFLTAYDRPALGCCFGHQILGMIHGAEISRCPEDRDWQTIQLKHADPLLVKLPAEVKFMEDHCECISLPPGWQLLGSSSTAENEIMRHPTAPKYGVQFHPEVSEKYGNILLQNFANLVAF